jgi:hypothetical protein
LLGKKEEYLPQSLRIDFNLKGSDDNNASLRDLGNQEVFFTVIRVRFFSLLAYRFGVVCNQFIVLVTGETGLESFQVIKGRWGTFCSFGLVVREGDWKIVAKI